MKEEKSKKRKLILPLFIIFTMAFSILSFSFFYIPNENTIKYKDKKFNFVNNLWVSYIDGKELVIRNDPGSLNDINLEGFNLKSINKVYLSKNPEYDLNNELIGLNNIMSFLGVDFVDSCFEDLESCKELPLKKCEDATDSIAVIEIPINNENKVEKEGNCLKINGDSEFLTKVIDKIVLDTLL